MQLCSSLNILELPGGSEDKASACHARDLGSIPGLGRSPGEGNGNLLSILAWRTPWTEEPSGLQSTGLQRVGHNWASSLHLKILWHCLSLGLEWKLTISSLVYFSFYLHAFHKCLSPISYQHYIYFCINIVLTFWSLSQVPFVKAKRKLSAWSFVCCSLLFNSSGPQKL